jgi:hypothetical protein
MKSPAMACTRRATGLKAVECAPGSVGGMRTLSARILDWSLTRAVINSLDAVMVGWPGAAQDLACLLVRRVAAWSPSCSGATGRRMLSCWYSGLRTH